MMFGYAVCKHSCGLHLLDTPTVDGYGFPYSIIISSQETVQTIFFDKPTKIDYCDLGRKLSAKKYFPLWQSVLFPHARPADVGEFRLGVCESVPLANVFTHPPLP